MLVFTFNANAQYSEQLLQKAQSGDAAAHFELGESYYDANWYRNAAGSNHAEAQYKMGLCCLNGIGTDINKRLAEKSRSKW